MVFWEWPFLELSVSCSNNHTWNIPVLHPFPEPEHLPGWWTSYPAWYDRVDIRSILDLYIVFFQVVAHHFPKGCFLWGIFFPCHKINLQTGKSILHQFEGLHKLWGTLWKLAINITKPTVFIYWIFSLNLIQSRIVPVVLTVYTVQWTNEQYHIFYSYIFRNSWIHVLIGNLISVNFSLIETISRSNV